MNVRGLGDENFFDELSVSKATGRHSVCKFTQRLDDEKLSAYQNSVGKTIGVALDGGRKIFFGELSVSKAAGRHGVCKFTQRLDDEKLSSS